MRVVLTLLSIVVVAGCVDRAAPTDPRRPVSLYLKTGEFLRAEYVDSVWMASIDPQVEARARAMELWRQYGTPGLDSVVVWVSNRAEMEYGADKVTLWFPFTEAELHGAPSSVTLLPDPTRPVEVEIESDYIRAAFIDSVLVDAEYPHQREQMHALARQVWGRYGAPVDSVIVEVANRAPPTPETARLPHRDPHTTVIGHFRPDELEES